MLKCTIGRPMIDNCVTSHTCWFGVDSDTFWIDPVLLGTKFCTLASVCMLITCGWWLLWTISFVPAYFIDFDRLIKFWTQGIIMVTEFFSLTEGACTSVLLCLCRCHLPGHWKVTPHPPLWEVFFSDLIAFMWSLALWSKDLPSSIGTALAKTSSSSTNVASSGFRWVASFHCCSTDMLADAFHHQLYGPWACLSWQTLVDWSGDAASSVRVCSLAMLRSEFLAVFGNLKRIVVSCFWHFVKNVSGTGCFLFMPHR